MQKYDFLIVGGGIIGLSIARALKLKYPKMSIALIEKEKQVAEHASGRNSGVLHAGFYYSADSLKAQTCRLGNLALRDFCKSKQLPINQCGKLVVARNDSELKTLDDLLQRGKDNGVELYKIEELEAKKIEPNVQTYKHALWSPTTATVNPQQVALALAAELKKMGVDFYFNTRFIAKRNGKVYTNMEHFDVGFLINASGLQATSIAKQYGFAQNYDIIPFKGIYLYSNYPPKKIKTNIYPVPHLQNPFLGVHFTVTVDGHCKIGPTAIPAFWFEQYKLLSNFKMEEFYQVLSNEISLMLFSAFDFKKLAWNEMKKYSKKNLVKEASELLHDVKLEDFQKWGKPGIRAQLFCTKTKKLEMDFIIEHDIQSLHVLNAVSPAFTSSLPFGQYIVDKI